MIGYGIVFELTISRAILKSCAWRKAYEKLKKQQVIHRCQTTAVVSHNVFKVFLYSNIIIFMISPHISELSMFNVIQNLKKKNTLKILWNHNYNANPSRISPCCASRALLKFFLWLGKVFLFFCPEAADIFNGSLMSQRAKKRSLNFHQKEKPTSSKDVSITISKQFEQWMRFKKGEDFFKRLEREKKNLGSKYKIFLTKKPTERNKRLRKNVQTSMTVEK